MKKKIIIPIAVIIVLLLAIDIFGANYLVTFAIARKDSVNSQVAPESVTTGETDKIIAANSEEINENLKEWLEEADMTETSITSDDGLNLVADYFETDPDSHKYAIVIHGYTGNRVHMRAYGMYYADKDFNVLIPDLRSHGESEGDYIGMGWLDKADIVKWINYIVDMDSEAEIVLHGVSMGGATVMMTSGEDLPENVRVAVDDCGYTSVWDIFSDEVAYLFNLPSFPILNTASVISSIRAGYSFTEASSLEQIKKTSLPVFFTHGSVDNFVHTDMVYELYDACPTDKDLYVAEGAGHGQAMYLDPELYFDKIFTFIGKYVD
ncbi:MAG: alpha/beta hydrolase [Lachnospiraceae bacterium]|nr:alpha/beta hydrolase [Lachnospiraceae bacterium]